MPSCCRRERYAITPEPWQQRRTLCISRARQMHGRVQASPSLNGNGNGIVDNSTSEVPFHLRYR